MQLSDFRQAREFARRYGAKAIVYGKPGTGKTPIANTAPRPLLLVCEPGMLSMRNSTIPAIDCFTPERIEEFFTWLFNSKEATNFDTIAIDSISQMAEIILDRELNGKSKASNKVDGRAAYGNMSRKMMEYLNGLFFLQNKHTYLICKAGTEETNAGVMNVPYFPGKDLSVKVPHLYDAILHLGLQNIPGVGQTKAFRCAASYDTVARDRSGNLAEFEQCDLAALFNKIMA
jgi:hypothetical protein